MNKLLHACLLVFCMSAGLVRAEDANADWRSLLAERLRNREISNQSDLTSSPSQLGLNRILKTTRSALIGAKLELVLFPANAAPFEGTIPVYRDAASGAVWIMDFEKNNTVKPYLKIERNGEILVPLTTEITTQRFLQTGLRWPWLDKETTPRLPDTGGLVDVDHGVTTTKPHGATGWLYADFLGTLHAPFNSKLKPPRNAIWVTRTSSGGFNLVRQGETFATVDRKCCMTFADGQTDGFWEFQKPNGKPALFYYPYRQPRCGKLADSLILDGEVAVPVIPEQPNLSE